MPTYHDFIGIDIGKFNFVVSHNCKKNTQEYANDSAGIAEFIRDYKNVLAGCLCVLETTGGHELALLYTLCQHNFPVHRADTRKVKNFVRSFGSAAKTDSLDAKALSTYAKERADTLALFSPPSHEAIHLFQLVQRRHDLTKMLVAEKNRLKAPSCDLIQESLKAIVGVLTDEIKTINEKIRTSISADSVLAGKLKVLKTVPGIGDIIATNLLILLPELGRLTRRRVASLTGLAPRANESGKFRGYRRTGHGRMGIKPMLFLAAMAARNSKSELKDFYESLVARGKKKMVALTALMRKIITIANARLRDNEYLGG